MAFRRTEPTFHVGERGYDLVDDFGNEIVECGFGCITKIVKPLINSDVFAEDWEIVM